MSSLDISLYGDDESNAGDNNDNDNNMALDLPRPRYKSQFLSKLDPDFSNKRLRDSLN